MRSASDRLLRIAQEEGPEAAAIELDRRCPFCSKLYVPVIQKVELAWEPQPRYRLSFPECRCPEHREARLEHEDDQVRLSEERRILRLHNSGLVGWLEHATLDSFGDRDDWPGAKEVRDRVKSYIGAMVNYKPDFLKSPWLILHGTYGTGKSHLAATIVHEAMLAGWKSCHFLVWPDYLRRVQLTWDRDNSANGGRSETEREVLAMMKESDLVVIDDLDKRRPSPWTKEMLFEGLNYRYNERYPTVLTFNYGPDDRDENAPGRLALEEYLGRATLDRLIELAFDVVPFLGPSHRSQLEWSR